MLDWLVGSGELALKPVAIITASPTPTGGLRGMMSLVQTLLAQQADIVAPIADRRGENEAECIGRNHRRDNAASYCRDGAMPPGC